MTTHRRVDLRTVPSSRARWASALFVLAALAAPGCVVDSSTGESEETAWDSAALGVEAASLTDAALELDGVPVGAATQVSIDEDGLVHVTFVAGEAAPLFEHALHELAGESTLAGLRVQGTDATSKSVREIEMTECLLKEVSFSDLDAKEGKKLLKVTVTFTPTEVKYSNGSGAPIAAAPATQIHWGLEVDGLPSEALDDVSLTARRQPTKNYAAWTVDGLKVSGSHAYGADVAAEALVATGQLVDVTLTLTDESTGATSSVTTSGTASKFTTAAENKGGADGAANWSLDVLCENQTVSVKQRA